MRVLLDTNVLISGLIFPDGPPGKVLRLIGTPGVVLLISQPILDEFKRVLFEKFSYSPFDTNEAASVILDEAELIETVSHIDAIRDDSTDNRILECARDGRADIIVSGDMKHLRKMRVFEGIPILAPTDFIHIFPGVE